MGEGVLTSKRIHQIGCELVTRARIAESIQAKYLAHLGLHSAAVLDSDKDQIMEHRQALHVLLDRLLDNGEAVQRLLDEQREINLG